MTVKHLVAEYKEVMRLPGNLQTSLNRKSKPFSMTEIPKEYTMGKGHVKYFYNKFGYLKSRFESLVQEMLRRGYHPNYTDSSIFNTDVKWMGNWIPNEKDMNINRQRIAERLKG